MGKKKEEFRTQKETIEFDGEFLGSWNEWCDRNGYVKRAVAHAARMMFMEADSQQRERYLGQSVELVRRARQAR